MKILTLYFRMLRHRVAIMLLLFFLLGVASGHKITVFSFDIVWAAIALASSYVAATTMNDIADQKIDMINHRSSKGRPLVTGEATKKDLLVVHFLAAALVLLFAGLINQKSVMVLSISLLINYIYSLPPLKVSYRTHFAPVLLSIAYVFIPFWLGTAVARSEIKAEDACLVGGLLFLFFGRIILKDFRDREGDALYNKPTFLIRYDKKVTCWISLGSIAVANIMLFAGLSKLGSAILLVLELYFVTIVYMLLRLYQASAGEGEQIAIGIGAKMGNGLLITILGSLILLEYGAPMQTQLLFLVSITSIFLLNYYFLAMNPDRVINGYRG